MTDELRDYWTEGPGSESLRSPGGRRPLRWARRPSRGERAALAMDERRTVHHEAVSARLREEFLAAHPDLDERYVRAIREAPAEVFVSDSQEMTPYDPADYVWSAEELWAQTDYCRECCAPAYATVVAAHFGWGLELTCGRVCGHAHHESEVWLA